MNDIEYEYGTAVKEADGHLWDHEPVPTLADARIERSSFDDDPLWPDDGSHLVIIRRVKATEWAEFDDIYGGTK